MHVIDFLVLTNENIVYKTQHYSPTSLFLNICSTSTCSWEYIDDMSIKSGSLLQLINAELNY